MYNSNGYSWEPFHGVNRAKWPNTWWTLVKLYFSGKWYDMVKHVYPAQTTYREKYYD